jgi:Flp pilus assembly protein TadG
MKQRSGERGSGLLLVAVLTLILAGISGAYMSVSYINTQKSVQAASAAQARYIAESAAGLMVHTMNHPFPAVAPGTPVPVPPAFSTPRPLAGGEYTITDVKSYPGGEFVRFIAQARHTGVTRRLDVLVSRVAGGVFWNAVYAGNSSGAKYGLNFDGTSTNADQIWGDMYSGGDFSATGTTDLRSESGVTGTNSTITYAGDNTSTISGPTYKPGSQPGLSLPRNSSGQSLWEEKAAALRSGSRRDGDGVAYIDVAHDLASKGSYGKWVDGSSATQITNVKEPSHIFRRNPTSTSSTKIRTEAYEYTKSAKNDYYIEDPTNSKVNTASLSGVPVNGNTQSSKVNIDGNLRVSGEPVMSYQFQPTAGTGTLQMTMVVKGNVSLTDNLLYPSWQSKTDGLAIIALEDPAFPNVSGDVFAQSGSTKLTSASGMTIDQYVADYNSRAAAARKAGKNIPNLDLSSTPGRERAAQEYNKSYGSGNVYFGDPGSGTVEHFEGFLYAENNFYATNLDSTTSSGGTQKVEIYGNMTAGNQVSIVRDKTAYGYIPLIVKFNDLIKDPVKAKPPALPATPSFGSGDWFVASWKEVPYSTISESEKIK